MYPTKISEDAPKDVIGQWLTEAQASGPAEDGSGHRRWPRFPWLAMLDVYVQAKGLRAPRAILANARDISRSGLGFFCRKSLPAYERITICRAGERLGLPARVINCTQTIGGYFIGVEFASKTPASISAAAVA